jgi:cytochrome c
MAGVLALPAAAAEEGRAVFVAQCQVCHATEAGAPARQGPSLHAIMGRKAGAIEGFPYSKGLKAAGFEWTPERMDRWIADPQAMISDSYMAYKQPDPEIRAKVIAYLATLGEK